MLQSFLLGIFFQISAAQFDCGYNCLCFDDLVDCSRKNLRTIPAFEEIIVLSTKNLLLRHMPDLDLTSFDCDTWINLREMNLKGEYMLISINYRELKFDKITT